MILDKVQDSVVHHAANAAAVTIPAMSIALHGPEILSYTTAGLGCVWYGILIGERVAAWISRWHTNMRRTAQQPKEVKLARAVEAGQAQYRHAIATAEDKRTAVNVAAQADYDKK